MQTCRTTSNWSSNPQARGAPAAPYAISFMHKYWHQMEMREYKQGCEIIEHEYVRFISTAAGSLCKIADSCHQTGPQSQRLLQIYGIAVHGIRARFIFRVLPCMRLFDWESTRNNRPPTPVCRQTGCSPVQLGVSTPGSFAVAPKLTPDVGIFRCHRTLVQQHRHPVWEKHAHLRTAESRVLALTDKLKKKSVFAIVSL